MYARMFKYLCKTSLYLFHVFSLYFFPYRLIHAESVTFTYMIFLNVLFLENKKKWDLVCTLSVSLSVPVFLKQFQMTWGIVLLPSIYTFFLSQNVIFFNEIFFINDFFKLVVLILRKAKVVRFLIYLFLRSWKMHCQHFLCICILLLIYH